MWGSRWTVLPLIVCVLFVAVPVSAQSVGTVVEEMRRVRKTQLADIDNYILDTTEYMAFFKKYTTEGHVDLEAKMVEGGRPVLRDIRILSVVYLRPLDHIEEHASYAGTKTVDGVRCHVLRMDVMPEASQGGAYPAPEAITYYVDAERHMLQRMDLRTDARSDRGTTMSVNLGNYQTFDGLVLPQRMTLSFDTKMPTQRREKIKRMIQTAQQLPEEKREQVYEKMGRKIRVMKKVVYEDTMAVEVLGGTANEDAVEAMF